MMEPLTNDQVLTHVRSKLKTKGATGEAVAARLLALTHILVYPCLSLMLTDPDAVWPRLATHFKSPLALLQHVGAVVTAIKLLGATKLCPGSAVGPGYKQLLGKWEARSDETATRCKEQESSLRSMFKSADAAVVSASTIAGYVSNLMQMLALLNVSDVLAVVTNPTLST